MLLPSQQLAHTSCFTEVWRPGKIWSKKAWQSNRAVVFGTAGFVATLLVFLIAAGFFKAFVAGFLFFRPIQGSTAVF